MMSCPRAGHLVVCLHETSAQKRVGQYVVGVIGDE